MTANLPANYDPALLDKLTPRQRMFVEHPEVMTNVQKAAVDVGYSPLWARGNAASMRKQLMYYILPIAHKRMAVKGITLDRIQEELGSIAFADESELYESVDTEDGRTILVGKDPKLLPEAVRRAVQQINVQNEQFVDKDGNPFTFQIITYLLHDKKVALKMLAEMLGGFDPKNRTPGDAESRKKQAALFDFMTSEEFDTLVKIYNRAAERQKKQATEPEVIEGKAEETKA